ncbi:flagellar assembly peptidoglycan hydrolase FlgJ [Allochromatium palmeri]|uniref:Peptidoglycan hydrolase FlgJ n=1 Tax=Allochromatium palmeri TaxID=231048 RepID=A0A6N8EEF2_9GAMM|nr:flagellar assembly peptidoglycan hydrolase FlgJ [Allochromatium palmeri]MTW20714.1 flagellar assembly peptidoglycan hydrolase FlgJ [Allochromatium palmeri]
MLSSSASSLGLGSSQPSTAGLVADPNAYQGLSRVARDGGAEGLEAAARAFESLLVGQMLKQMRSTTLGGGLFDSAQTQLYQDLYDQQIATVLSEGDGLGIRKALLRQLAPELSNEGRAERDPATLTVPERNPLLKSFKRRQIEAAVEKTDSKPVDAVANPSETSAGAATTSATTTTGARVGRSTLVSGGGRWPPRNAEEFVAYLKPYAEQAAEILGMDTSVLLAQSALETGWGKHIPRRANGNSSFNLFGIKADRSWKGDSVGVGTLEYRNGVAQREQAKFRAYETPADSFVDYVAFLKRNPRYGEALNSRTGEEFIRGLQKAGYATDPRYANKILGIRDRVLAIGAAIESPATPQTKSETQVSAAQADTPAKG